MSELTAYSTVAMTLGLVVARPRLGPRFRLTPAMAAVGGMALLFVAGIVKPAHFLHAASDLRSPFLAIGSIMVMTEVAERIGLLEWWAAHVERRATTTRALFLRVFCLGAATSSLLNNDAAILVLTPVVLRTVERRFHGRPSMMAPFAFAVFTSAGVAVLPVSNPMNMVVAELSGIGFGAYVLRMVPVAVAGWAVSYAGLRIVFAGELREPIGGVAVPPAEATRMQRRMMALLVSVLAAYPVVSWLGGPVWLVASSGALASLALCRGELQGGALRTAATGVSWETLLFLLAVLIMSLGLRDVGLVDRLSALYAGAGIGTIGIVSALGSAVLNNHPMSYLNLMALSPGSHGDPTPVLAALAGGDLGPRLLPMGSLAGLLWIEQARRHRLEIGVGRFFRVGLISAVPTLLLSLAILTLLR